VKPAVKEKSNPGASEMILPGTGAGAFAFYSYSSSLVSHQNWPLMMSLSKKSTTPKPLHEEKN
jgi:hypothetical protein